MSKRYMEDHEHDAMVDSIGVGGRKSNTRYRRIRQVAPSGERSKDCTD